MIRKYAEIFCWKNVSSFAKATHNFSAKHIRILYIESAKTVNEMTLNELVKLTTLWTTGPRPIWVLVGRIYMSEGTSSHVVAPTIGSYRTIQHRSHILISGSSSNNPGSWKKYSFTVIVSVLIENHYQTVTWNIYLLWQFRFSSRIIIRLWPEIFSYCDSFGSCREPSLDHPKTVTNDDSRCEPKLSQ